MRAVTSHCLLLCLVMSNISAVSKYKTFLRVNHTAACQRFWTYFLVHEFTVISLYWHKHVCSIIIIILLKLLFTGITFYYNSYRNYDFLLCVAHRRAIQQSGQWHFHFKASWRNHAQFLGDVISGRVFWQLRSGASVCRTAHHSVA